jgi:PAS domain S-box-containing protein
MSESPPIIVFTHGGADDALAEIIEADSAFLNVTGLPDAVEQISTLHIAARPAALAVLGPDVSHPLASARELRRIDPAIGLAFLAAPTETHVVRTKLGLVPDLGGAVVVATDAGPAALGSALREAADTAARQRGVRAVVDEMNRRLLDQHADRTVSVEQRSVSESYLAAVMRHVPEAIVSVDAEGTVVSVNEVASSMLGLTARQVEGRDLAATLPSHPEEALREAIDGALAGGARERQEMQLTRPDGEEILAWVTAAPVRDHQGRTIGVVIPVQDITEARRSAVRLRHLQKAESLATLAGGVAHDFNNLLVVIQGWAEIAREDLEDREMIADALDHITASAERAADLAQAMLAYSGRGSFELRATDVCEAIAGIAGLLRSSIGPGVELVLGVDDDVPPVHADKTQLRQIIMNLVTNAAEAITTGSGAGTITLRTRLEEITVDDAEHVGIPAGDYVGIEVADTGPGMDEEALARVFEPFFTTKFPGRGLGLAASHGIARAHGGALIAKSAAGEGATFQLLLPPHTEDA